jgi:cephalosporin-C deacetylase-like acetyl esterase
MLTLHNWGGEDCVGTASPDVLAVRLNVVAVCVNYLQSGKQASIDDPEPYDCGYLQALDALRALWFVCDGLERGGREFDKGRLYCTGGSGGGNVTLMANKLAPRTFACIVDMCGMKKLSHDIAFNLPGGSGLDARWSRDPASANYLSADEQELRFVGHPGHLQVMKQPGASAKVIVVHGIDDATCPYADAVEMVANMRAAKVDVEAHFITRDDVDGTVFTSTGHSLGNRTEIVFHAAGRYLAPDGTDMLRRKTPSDFDRRDEVRYPTSGGAFVVSYKDGFPVGRFEASAMPPDYRDHHDLSYYLDKDGQRRPIAAEADWHIRHAHIEQHLQRVMGRLPGVMSHVPLDMKVIEETRDDRVLRRKLSYQSDPFDRVAAWLLMPGEASKEKRPAVLCLHQTTTAGKDEPAGLAGGPNMHYAIELALRGYVTLSPDYPSLGGHKYDFAANPEYASGSMKAIWDNIRAVDLLQSLPEVDAERIGVIGHSLGGHNAMFTAVFEPRLKVVVSSCGFTSLRKDDLRSWTGPRYMPRIATEFGNDIDKMPFDFPEIVAAFAPRPFLAVAATRDSDFDVSGVRNVFDAAGPIYRLFNKPEHLQSLYPDSPHDFPPAARQHAYDFIDRHLQR